MTYIVLIYEYLSTKKHKLYSQCTLLLTSFLSISIFFIPDNTLCPIVPATQYPGIIN